MSTESTPSITKCSCGSEAAVTTRVHGWWVECCNHTCRNHVSCCGKWCWSGPAKASSVEAIEAWNKDPQAHIPHWFRHLMAGAGAPSLSWRPSATPPDEKPAGLYGQQAADHVVGSAGEHPLDVLARSMRTGKSPVIQPGLRRYNGEAPDIAWRPSPVRRWLARAAWFLAGAAALAAAWLVATGRALP